MPPAVLKDAIAVDQALLERRSIREFAAEPLTLTEVSQLLWAVQGIHPGGLRTAPSARARYPLEIFLLVRQVSDLKDGGYRNVPRGHELYIMLEGDHRQEFNQTALGQSAIRDAPAEIVLAAVYERTKVKYGERGGQSVHIEVGGASENIYLQAASFGLGRVFIGAFHDEQVNHALQLGADEQPLGIIPVGMEQVP